MIPSSPATGSTPTLLVSFWRRHLGVVLVVALALPSLGQARCGDAPEDADAMAAAREAIEAKCHCDFAPDHRSYIECAVKVLKARVADRSLPRACAAAIRRCTAHSTCGIPNAVACCRTSITGKTRCSIESDASRCVARSGGHACVSGATSSCDACNNEGCRPTPTPTPRLTPTLPAFCQPVVPLAGARVPFKTAPGTDECGGGATPTPAAPPISGSVTDGDGNTLTELGLGCLYTGALPALRIPDGATSLLEVTGSTLLTLTLGGSDGNGPFDCTRAYGPGGRCVNGAPGNDGNGACNKDKDCGALGTCGPEIRCFFGPPIPVPNGPLSACVINGFMSDMCGSVDLASRQQTIAATLQSALFLTGDGVSPCPRCIDGTCSAGARAGEACTAVGSMMTSLDCPPGIRQYFGTLTVQLPQLTTGTSSITADSSGYFCSDQTIPGALGYAAARNVSETGIPLGGGGSLLSTGLAGTFCVPRSGNDVLDYVANLPAVGTFSAAGTIELTGVLPLP